MCSRVNTYPFSKCISGCQGPNVHVSRYSEPLHRLGRFRILGGGQGLEYWGGAGFRILGGGKFPAGT